MPEADGELLALQALIDRSWARAGPSLRAAWAPDRRMTAAQAVAFCAGQRHCVLAVARGSRPPILTPVSFHLTQGGTVWLPTDPGAVRVHAVRRHPAAAVAVGQGVSDTHRTVLASGPATLVPADEVPQAAAREAGAKLGDLSWAGLWIRLEPRRFFGYDAGSEGSLSSSPG